MDGSANHLRILIILLAVAGVLLAVAGLGTISASRVYCVETELSAAPDDDTALEFWLKNQPGVVQHTVRVDRVTTDRPKLVLTLMMVQNGWLNQSGRNSASDFDQSVNLFGRAIHDETDLASCRGDVVCRGRLRLLIAVCLGVSLLLSGARGSSEPHR